MMKRGISQMGLLSRIKDAMGLAETKKVPEDQVKEARRQIDEATEIHRWLEGNVAALMSQETSLQGFIDGLVGEVTKWNHLAYKAAEAGKQEAVTAAVIQREKAKNSLSLARRKMGDLKEAVARIDLDGSSERLFSAKNALDQIIDRGGDSDVKEKMAAILGGSSDSSMSKVNEHVMPKEVKAEALSEIAIVDSYEPSPDDDEIKAQVERIMRYSVGDGQ